MTRRTPNQTAGKVMFVRPDKDVDENLEHQGLVFLALELDEIPPAEKRRTRKASTTGKRTGRPDARPARERPRAAKEKP